MTVQSLPRHSAPDAQEARFLLVCHHPWNVAGEFLRTQALFAGIAGSLLALDRALHAGMNAIILPVFVLTLAFAVTRAVTLALEYHFPRPISATEAYLLYHIAQEAQPPRFADLQRACDVDSQILTDFLFRLLRDAYLASHFVRDDDETAFCITQKGRRALSLSSSKALT